MRRLMNLAWCFSLARSAFRVRRSPTIPAMREIKTTTIMISSSVKPRFGFSMIAISHVRLLPRTRRVEGFE